MRKWGSEHPSLQAEETLHSAGHGSSVSALILVPVFKVSFQGEPGAMFSWRTSRMG